MDQFLVRTSANSVEANRLKILVVDDNRDDLTTLTAMLGHALPECAMLAALDAAGGIALARAQDPDAILFGIAMAGMEGFEVCRRLKTEECLRDVPVIFLTAPRTDREIRVRALEAGADAFLSTPLDEQELVALLRVMAKLKSANRLRRREQDELDAPVVDRIHALERELDPRKRTEEALRESEERFAIAFQSSPVAVVISSAVTQQFVEANDAFLRDTGFTRDEIIGHTSDELGLFRELGDRERLIARLRKEGFYYCMDVRFRTKAGDLRDALISSQVIRWHGEPHLLSTTIDVTERKRAEVERERLMTAIEQAAEMILVTDAEGAIVYVNPAFEAVTGYACAEVLGRTLSMLKSDMQDDAFFRALWETISSGKTWRGRLVNKKKDGARYTEEATISPVRDAAGVITSYVAVKRDITRDLELEAQLLQSQRMEAIGRLAGGIAHDFNNLLCAILSYTEFALEAVGDGGPARKDLLEIKKASERAASLTGQLLAFSRKQVLQPQTLDLNQILVDLERMLHRILGEDIDLVQVLALDLGLVKADPGQVEQVIMNLAVNARDAMSEGGKLTIETANVELDAEYAAQHQSVKPGPYVLVAVTDSGVGMDEQTMAHLFEPFFTTKGVGKGTGLGLSTVYGIVKQSGGNIWVYSEPGQGTTFKIHFPRETSVARAAASMPPTAPRRVTGTETILLVEDEDALRRVAARILGMAGYTVLTAANADQALLICSQQAGEIHLLVTDVVMPRMSGRVLAERLAETRSTLQVLYMSGYTDNAIVHHGVLDPETHFLAKPFTAADLTRKVREVLDGGITQLAHDQVQATEADGETKE